jgi:hypothetical protein
MATADSRWFGARDARQCRRGCTRRVADRDGCVAWWRRQPLGRAAGGGTGCGHAGCRDRVVDPAAIPFAVIERERRVVGARSGTRDRLAEVERLRPLLVVRTAITPTDGALLHRLNPTKAQPALPMRSSRQRPWETMTLGDEMFAGPRHGQRGAMAAGIVTAAARSCQELAYLRSVAEAPIWRDVERLVSAPAVDMIGGRFVAVPCGCDGVGDAGGAIQRHEAVVYAGVSRGGVLRRDGATAPGRGGAQDGGVVRIPVGRQRTHALDAMIGQ